MLTKPFLQRVPPVAWTSGGGSCHGTSLSVVQPLLTHILLLNSSSNRYLNSYCSWNSYSVLWRTWRASYLFRFPHFLSLIVSFTFVASLWCDLSLLFYVLSWIELYLTLYDRLATHMFSQILHYASQIVAESLSFPLFSFYVWCFWFVQIRFPRSGFDVALHTVVLDVDVTSTDQWAAWHPLQYQFDTLYGVHSTLTWWRYPFISPLDHLNINISIFAISFCCFWIFIT